MGTSIEGLAHHLLGFAAQKQQTDALGATLAQLTHQADAIALLKVFGHQHQIRGLHRVGQGFLLSAAGSDQAILKNLAKSQGGQQETITKTEQLAAPLQQRAHGRQRLLNRSGMQINIHLSSLGMER